MTIKFDIKMDDLPPDFREIAETIGLDPALKLVQVRGGEGIYIPKAEKVRRAARDRAIRAEFNGKNHRELARRYGLTVVWIRAIVAQNHDLGAGVDIIDKQIPLF
jgi:Mor family transcriptional regulator